LGELSGPVFHKLQHSHRMFSADSWKISEKIVKPISLLDIVDKAFAPGRACRRKRRHRS
jgi:hypothetical protein